MNGESVNVLADGILLTCALVVLIIPLLAWLHEQPPHQPSGRDHEQPHHYDAEALSEMTWYD